MHTIKVRTPFRSAKKYVNIHSRDCIMISYVTLEKIALKGENTKILFDIEFEEFGVREQRETTVAEIKWMVEKGIAKKRYVESMGFDAINIDRQTLNEHVGFTIL